MGKGTPIPIMLDSGAWSFFADKSKILQDWPEDKPYWEAPQYVAYRDAYGEFLKAHGGMFDTCVNLDVIGNAEASLNNQQKLEQTGASILPVYHVGEPVAVLRRYVERYEYIGISGLATLRDNSVYNRFATAVFSVVCPAPTYMPRVKVHGFGIGVPSMILRYPFYSVDSTAYIMIAVNGMVFVPRRSPSGWRYDLDPLKLPVARKVAVGHYSTLSSQAREHVDEYLATVARYTAVELGDDEGGRGKRIIANIRYLVEFSKVIPKWPRPWVNPRQSTVLGGPHEA